MEKYQELNYEQTLLNQEIEHLNATDPSYQQLHTAKGVDYSMSEPLLSKNSTNAQ